MTWEVRQGDVLDRLREIPDGSVHCAVTSPPYWGLRDYGTATWEGGDAGCDHKRAVAYSAEARAKSTIGDYSNTGHAQEPYRNTCGKCGATRIDQQLGLEATPEAYVARMVEVFREVRRTLRSDGCLFLNCGDSYSTKEYGRIRDHENEAFFKLSVEVRRQVFGVWRNALPLSLSRDVRNLLSEGVEEEEPATSKVPCEAVLRNKQGGVFAENRQAEQGEAGGDDSATRGQVRVLRRNRADVSLSGSHQGRRPPGLSEIGRIERGLEEGDQRRLESKEVPDSLLELQRRAWSVWKVPTLQLDLADVPREARGLFDVDIKPKDLVGIPWLLAFALRADGWYLRSDIIWSKPNPMPESVTDRPTKAHEYLFLMSKNARYWYDSRAVAEPISEATMGDAIDGHEKRREGQLNGADKGNGRLGRTRWPGIGPQHAAVRDRGEKYEDMAVNSHRNRRTVWTIATQPYPEAHFATYPEALVEPCIKAGCPEGGTVLDPFSGSGTTGAVAVKLGRSYIGIELSPQYVVLSLKRIGMAERPHTYRSDFAEASSLFHQSHERSTP